MGGRDGRVVESCKEGTWEVSEGKRKKWGRKRRCVLSSS
jgi:hypothetical protein